ncbi:hypothetical protein D3C77_749290 [compost metagenome]
MVPRASAIMTPQATTSAGTDRPTKLRMASTMMAMPICRLNKVRISGTRPGSISRSITRIWPKPISRAAVT